MLTFDLGDGAQLRLIETRDASALYALIERNRARLSRTMDWAADQTLASTQAFIATTRRQLADDDGFQTVIVADGRIAGAVGLHGIDRRERSTSIGYWLGAEFEGRGLMTRAVRAYTDHAFTDLGLHRMELRAATTNTRSRAVAERLGFREEGVLRGAGRIGERFEDLVVYAALSPEWPGPGLP